MKMEFCLLTLMLTFAFLCKGQKNNNCSRNLKNLVITSDLKNYFKDRLNVEFENIESDKATLKLFVKEEEKENTVGWIIIDKKNNRLLDITNDIENPITLTYNKKLWNNVLKCYFKIHP